MTAGTETKDRESAHWRRLSLAGMASVIAAVGIASLVAVSRAEALPPAPPAVDLQPPPTSSPSPAPAATLGRDQIREVQKRLQGFGFKPGPIDGIAGRQTEVATQHYLEARGQPQLPPTDPQLLDQLRHDKSPPAGPRQRAQQPAQGTARAAAHRSFDPFAPVKVAGSGITRALEFVFRRDAARQDSASSR